MVAKLVATIFIVLAGLAFLAGLFVFDAAESVMHEIFAAALWLLSAALVGIGVLCEISGALARLRADFECGRRGSETRRRGTPRPRPGPPHFGPLSLRSTTRFMFAQPHRPTRSERPTRRRHQPNQSHSSM